jgi:hypothetical protein
MIESPIRHDNDANDRAQQAVNAVDDHIARVTNVMLRQKLSGNKRPTNDGHRSRHRPLPRMR